MGLLELADSDQFVQQRTDLDDQALAVLLDRKLSAGEIPRAREVCNQPRVFFLRA